MIDLFVLIALFVALLWRYLVDRLLQKQDPEAYQRRREVTGDSFSIEHVEEGEEERS